MSMTETTETKRRAYSIMLSDEERERIEKTASRYGDSFSNWMRTLALEVCERDEQKGRKNDRD